MAWYKIIKCPECGKVRKVDNRRVNGKGFTGRCKTCWGNYRRKQMNGREIRTCEICGKEYEGFKCRANIQKTCSWECHKVYISKILKGVKRGKRLDYRGQYHPNWKADKACYTAHHMFIYIRKKRMHKCEYCDTIIPRRKDGAVGTHFANISREYKRDVSDYIELCPKCHAAYDSNKITL